MLELLLAVGLAASQDLPPVAGKPVLPDFDAEIEALIPALGDDSYEIRQKADQELRKLALPFDEEPALRAALKRGLKHSDPEVRGHFSQLLGELPLFKVSFDVDRAENAYGAHPVDIVIKNISGEDQPYLEHWGAPDFEAEPRLSCRIESALGALHQYLMFFPTRNPEQLKGADVKSLEAGKELVLRSTAIPSRHFARLERVTIHAYASWQPGAHAREFAWKDGKPQELYGDGPFVALPRLRVVEWKPKP